MDVYDYNLKEVNYCLRHHTNATLNKFNLKHLALYLGNPYLYDSYCGYDPIRGVDFNYCDTTDQWLSFVVFKDYGD